MFNGLSAFKESHLPLDAGFFDAGNRGIMYGGILDYYTGVNNSQQPSTQNYDPPHQNLQQLPSRTSSMQ